MNKVGLLDCTLRDGAYVVDTKFGENTIAEIIRCLVESGIDIIECGFLRNKKGCDGSTEFSKPLDIKKYIPADLSGSKFVLMFDSGRFDVHSLPKNDGTIFGIRDCFHKENRTQAFEDAKILVEKGYKVFIQPTGILQYSDTEIIELMQNTNKVGAYSFAIVDTFGSMDKSDLVRLFYLIHHNLESNIVLSFHSHNNQQMALALSQDFVTLGLDKRDLLVDTTVYGMGRGAGNACTENMAFYLNKHNKKQYDTEKILDLIESQIRQIYAQTPWGYNVRNLVAGMYGCHIDNVSYLYEKGNILSSDVKRILEDIPEKYRTHFHQEILEETLENYRNEYIDDRGSIALLEEALMKKNILIVCPGKTLKTESKKISEFQENNELCVIGINFVPQNVECDYLFFSNPQRLHFWEMHLERYIGKLIITSNLSLDINAIKVNFHGLSFIGRKHGENATLMCLRLLDKVKVGNIYFAGFDGYASGSTNYLSRESENRKSDAEMQFMNYEIADMLLNFKNNMQVKRKLEFITKSRFEEEFL